jgi:hypothetical protein
MGFKQRSAALIFPLLSGALAVTLGELGVPAPSSSEPAACNDAYRSSILHCSLADFDNGCSAVCMVGVTTTFDGLKLECSPGYVSTLLGSSLSFAGVKLLCPNPLLGKGSVEPKSVGRSAQATSVPGSRTSTSLTKSSSTIQGTATTRSPVISKGPPPNSITTLLPAVTPLANSSSLSLGTSTLVEPGSTVSGITFSATYVTSSFLTRAPNPIPTRESIPAATTSSISPTQSLNSTTALPAGGIGHDGSKKPEKSSAGPIVGGVLGGVATITLLVILTFFFLVRPLRRRQAEEDADYHQKTTPLDSNTLTHQVTPPGGPRWSSSNPYRLSQPPNMITKPYRSNSNRSAVLELVRHDSRMSNRSIHRSNSISDRYDVSPVDRYGNPVFDPYSTSPLFDRYGPYGSSPMDRYGPYGTSPTSISRYDISPVAPLSFMEAEWNHLSGQPGTRPMRQSSASRRPIFNNYPSIIEEERESNVASSVQGSIYELPADGSSSKISVRRSEDNKRAGTPEVPRRSPLRVVNGAAES